MATEDLLVNDGCDGQTVEAVGEGLPQLYVVSPFTCERKKTHIRKSECWIISLLQTTTRFSGTAWRRGGKIM